MNIGAPGTQIILNILAGSSLSLPGVSNELDHDRDHVFVDDSDDEDHVFVVVDDDDYDDIFLQVR